jgi:hypothetical protein
MTRTTPRTTVAAAALVVTAVAAPLSACQSPAAGPPPASSSHGTPPAATGGSSPSGTISAGADAVYVTGARPDDGACPRVVSAIGYLGLSLLPEGQEDAQHWDGDVRGRFGYLRGTLQMYGPRLPASLSDETATIDRVAGVLTNAGTDPAIRPGLLREYRKASDAVTAACRKPAAS